jgi:hypothetical protein
MFGQAQQGSGNSVLQIRTDAIPHRTRESRQVTSNVMLITENPSPMVSTSICIGN